MALWNLSKSPGEVLQVYFRNAVVELQAHCCLCWDAQRKMYVLRIRLVGHCKQRFIPYDQGVSTGKWTYDPAFCNHSYCNKFKRDFNICRLVQRCNRQLGNCTTCTQNLSCEIF